MDMNITVVLCVVFFGVLLVGWIVIGQGRRLVAARTEQVAGEIASSLADTFVFVSRQRALAWTAAAVLLLPLAVLLLSRSVIIAVLALPVAFMVPGKYMARMRRRRLLALEQQLPDALLMMAGAMRAGASFPMAVESVAAEAQPPVSQEFDLLMREIRLGVDLNVSLANMETRIPIADFLMVTAAVSISREVGGNLAESLESVARTLREKAKMEGKIRALTAQGRMQGIVMTGLPMLLIVVLSRMEPTAMAPLFSEPVGWATLAVIAVMEFLGYQSICKITHIDV